MFGWKRGPGGGAVLFGEPDVHFSLSILCGRPGLTGELPLFMGDFAGARESLPACSSLILGDVNIEILIIIVFMTIPQEVTWMYWKILNL